jgi:hypothetical protein
MKFCAVNSAVAFSAADLHLSYKHFSNGAACTGAGADIACLTCASQRMMQFGVHLS